MPQTVEILCTANAKSILTRNFFDYSYPNLKELHLHNCEEITNFMIYFPLTLKKLYVTNCDWVRKYNLINLHLGFDIIFH